MLKEFNIKLDPSNSLFYKIIITIIMDGTEDGISENVHHYAPHWRVPEPRSNFSGKPRF